MSESGNIPSSFFSCFALKYKNTRARKKTIALVSCSHRADLYFYKTCPKYCISLTSPDSLVLYYCHPTPKKRSFWIPPHKNTHIQPGRLLIRVQELTPCDRGRGREAPIPGCDQWDDERDCPPLLYRAPQRRLGPSLGPAGAEPAHGPGYHPDGDASGNLFLSFSCCKATGKKKRGGGGIGKAVKNGDPGSHYVFQLCIDSPSFSYT